MTTVSESTAGRRPWRSRVSAECDVRTSTAMGVQQHHQGPSQRNHLRGWRTCIESECVRKSDLTQALGLHLLTHCCCCCCCTAIPGFVIYSYINLPVYLKLMHMSLCPGLSCLPVCSCVCGCCTEDVLY